METYTQYVQCRMRKTNRYMLAWVPECYAKRGRILTLSMSDGVKQTGWVIVHVLPFTTSSTGPLEQTWEPRVRN